MTKVHKYSLDDQAAIDNTLAALPGFNLANEASKHWREFDSAINPTTCDIRHLHELPETQFSKPNLFTPNGEDATVLFRELAQCEREERKAWGQWLPERATQLRRQKNTLKQLLFDARPCAGFSVSDVSKFENLTKHLLAGEHSWYYEHSPAGRRESAGETRLVKECKSATKIPGEKRVAEIAQKHKALAQFQAFLEKRGDKLAETIWQPETRYLADDTQLCNTDISSNSSIDFETGEMRFNPTQTGGTPPVVRVQHREWSNQYRIRVEASASPSEPPPQQGGDRVSTALTLKSASKIIDAGAYVAAVRGGMTTFLTLTFDAKQREKLDAGEITIGGEVSRFFDAAQRVYQRGWSCRGKCLKEQDVFKCIGATAKVKGYDHTLDYIWVAENPGNDNPHVHVLMRWRVEPWLFHDWAARVEKIWGHGFARLELIKKGEAASKYLLKALSYFAKGEDGSQGEIVGNRYGISKSARAPAWETIESFHAEHMAAIIGEIKHKLEVRERPTKRTLNKLNAEHAQAVKAIAIYKHSQPDKAAAIKKRIQNIEAKIKEQAGFISERKKKLWARDFQLTVTGKELFNQVMGWAVGARGWSAIRRQDGIPVPLDGLRKKYSAVRQRFEDLQAWWKSVLTVEAPQYLEQWQILLLKNGEIPSSEHESGHADYSQYAEWYAT